MRESGQGSVAASSSFKGTVVPKKCSGAKSSKFGVVVCALWPTKPGLHLAQAVGCSERHANLLIAGKRKPNARAVLAISAAIIE